MQTRQPLQSPMTSDRSSAAPCPCGSGSELRHCCGPVIADPSAAQTAEQLMRSRYTAFATGEARHLLASHKASAGQFSDRQVEQLKAEMIGQEWLGLRILDSEQGQNPDKTGIVEFTAYYRDTSEANQGPNIGQLHERSRFVREKDGWLYLDGEPLPPVPMGRNDPCWCGSGRKYKKCHLATM